jgi:hypothetical protein
MVVGMKRISVPHYLVLLIVLTSGSWAQLPGSLTNGLVAFYSFDGNADDQSGSANNGTVFGATLTVDRFGFSNAAYSFNGINNYIEVPDSPTLRVQQLTLSAWVKSDTASPGQQEIITIDGFKRGYRLLNYSAPSGVAFLIGGGEWAGTVSGTPLITNSWTFVSGTYDGTNISLYLDGILVSSVVDTGGISYSGSSLFIGRNGFTPTDFFFGSIDDITIYDRALESTEVTDLYNAQSVPEPSTYALLVLSGAASLWALKRRKS